MIEKIKSIMRASLESQKAKDILVIIIVILVGASSFELGRLSKDSDSRGINIEYTDRDGNVSQGKRVPDSLSATKAKSKTSMSKMPFDIGAISAEKNFFASKRGKKYYSLGCSAGKSIKQENRVYFETGEAAQKAGYTLSSSCN